MILKVNLFFPKGFLSFSGAIETTLARDKRDKILTSGLSLKKTVHVWWPHAKQRFIAIACDSKSHAVILWRVISVKLNIGMKITGLEIMTLNREIISLFPNLYNSCLRGSYTVYRDVLESRQVGRTFKLVNPKHENRTSVRNDSLNFNLFVCWVEICKQYVYF